MIGHGCQEILPVVPVSPTSYSVPKPGYELFRSECSDGQAAPGGDGLRLDSTQSIDRGRHERHGKEGAEGSGLITPWSMLSVPRLFHWEKTNRPMFQPLKVVSAKQRQTAIS